MPGRRRGGQLAGRRRMAMVAGLLMKNAHIYGNRNESEHFKK